MAAESSRVDVARHVQFFHEQKLLPERADRTPLVPRQPMHSSPVPVNGSLVRLKTAIGKTEQAALAGTAATKQADMLSEADPEAERLQASFDACSRQLQYAIHRILPS
jgi:hypothetical protein